MDEILKLAIKHAEIATLLSLGTGNKAGVGGLWLLYRPTVKISWHQYQHSVLDFVCRFLMFCLVWCISFSGFGRQGVGPAAWSRQGCRGEQRKEPGLWCHGRDPWGCMGSPHHYVREATGTSGTYFSVLWKRSGGLYLNQITVLEATLILQVLWPL